VNPPAGLRESIATPDGKRRYVRRLFATIADRYDFITGFLSYGQDRKWKRRLIGMAELRGSDRVLDLACGTGDLLFSAVPPARSGVGLDVTHRMLQLAQRRRNDRRAPLVTADMLALPFADGHFTVVTTGYGLRNVPDLDLALREIHRVLAPGGRLLSLDFNRPGNPLVRGVYHAYLTVVGSLLGLALHADPDTYRYIPESIRNYPGATAVAGLMTHYGFADVRVVPVLCGLMAIHVAKKPTSTPKSQLPTPNHSQHPAPKP
jgi:demethylmenaquinone methyltransferase/2-methoxy-6-polyprenyl-1,4-benzoquinol methylase